MNYLCLPLALLLILNVSYAQSDFDDYYIQKIEDKVIYDNFYDNSNYWNLEVQGYGRNYCKISNMQFVVDLKDIKGAIKQNIMLPFEFNPERDFEINALIKTNENTQYQGIIWNYSKWPGDHNYLAFANNGSVNFGAYEDGNYNSLYSGKKDFIRKNSANSLTIRKIKNYYYYFINKNYVGYSPYTDLEIKTVGFMIAGEQSLFQANLLAVSYITKRIKKENYSSLRGKELIWKKIEGYKSMETKSGRVKYTTNYKPPLLPINFSWNAEDGFDASLTRTLVTPIGSFGIDADYDKYEKNNSIIVAFKDRSLKKEVAFRISDKARLEIVTDGISRSCVTCSVITFDITNLRNIELELIKIN